MSKWLGNYPENPTINFKFMSLNLNQVPTTLGSASLAVFKANDATESTSGATLSVDFDGTTGLNHVNIVGTDAFYATGNDFQVTLADGTVGGSSVIGMPLRDFSIQNRYGTVDLAISVPNPTDGTIGLVTTKTGYSLAADQSAVTIGTVNSSASANPTGGTIDLVVLTTDITTKTGYSLAADQSAVTIGTVSSSIAANPTGGTVELAIVTNTAVDVSTKTGYSLSADQSAVTIGTVNSSASANPTGGTIDLAILVSGGTTDLVTNAGTLLQTLSRAEPGQGNPAATTDSFSKNDYLYKWARNKKDNNGTESNIYADNGITVDQKSTVSSDGTTATIGEIVTGA